MNGSEHNRVKILKDIRHDLINPINAIIGYSEYVIEICTSNISTLFINDINTIYKSSKEIMKNINEIFNHDSEDEIKILKSILNEDILQFSLRTPLSTIIGLTELFQEPGLYSEELKMDDISQSIVHIRSSSINLLKKINNLNKYSDVDISSFIESYYTDIYLKESSVRQLSFLDIANNTIDPGTILIVDDELSNLELIEAILLKSNHNVLKAENALDAISILNDNIFKIDVIVLDVVMPNINGIELLKRIKSNDKAFHIPIIMLSATDDIDSIAETLLLGADDYLIKPINRVLLNARINNALEKKYFHDKELQYQIQIKTEQQKADALLLNILPETISHRLKKGETLIADKIDSATVLFADIVGFTSMSTKMNTKTILMMLNNIFSKFDELLIKYSLEKIKTIGDNYMLAGGVPENSSSHAEDVIQMAIEMLKLISEIDSPNNSPLQLKIGINSGSLSAGIIGKKKFIYDLWGDTVNVASRMEAYGVPGQIHITEGTYALIKDKYRCSKRDVIIIPGKGEMQTYLLNI